MWGACKWETRLIIFNDCINVSGAKHVVCEVLKRLRKIYGYKASEMSVQLGISPSYLSEIENGKKQPSLDHLKKYSQIFGIKLSSLILLAETYEEAESKGKGTIFVRNMMLSLINSMSNDNGTQNENTEI